MAPNRIWDLLSEEEQKLMASLMGDRIAAEPHSRDVHLECLSAIDRIMRTKPGELEHWPEEMIAAIEEEEE